ncbi:uncharacterized protein [Emydura macquarii macquarii]|uniref:uncharacterized protein n=1 Tax=Emydura macquarii macquarii TaxID=1129001 RepID=UPI00352A7673
MGQAAPIASKSAATPCRLGSAAACSSSRGEIPGPAWGRLPLPTLRHWPTLYCRRARAMLPAPSLGLPGDLARSPCSRSCGWSRVPGPQGRNSQTQANGSSAQAQNTVSSCREKPHQTVRTGLGWFPPGALLSTRPTAKAGRVGAALRAEALAPHTSCPTPASMAMTLQPGSTAQGQQNERARQPETARATWLCRAAVPPAPQHLSSRQWLIPGSRPGSSNVLTAARRGWWAARRPGLGSAAGMELGRARLGSGLQRAQAGAALGWARPLSIHPPAAPHPRQENGTGPSPPQWGTRRWGQGSWLLFPTLPPPGSVTLGQSRPVPWPCLSFPA